MSAMIELEAERMPEVDMVVELTEPIPPPEYFTDWVEAINDCIEITEERYAQRGETGQYPESCVEYGIKAKDVTLDATRVPFLPRDFYGYYDAPNDVQIKWNAMLQECKMVRDPSKPVHTPWAMVCVYHIQEAAR